MEDRKGNRPVRLVLVDTEPAEKAGHWVESAREMQFWAMTDGILPASTA